MELAGTHRQLNDALLQITAAEANSLYGAALYVVDETNGFAAPVSSVNFQAHEDVATYQNEYHRTKLTPDMAQAAKAAFDKDYTPTRSKAFKGHIVSHIPLGNSAVILQTVTKNTQTPMGQVKPEDEASLLEQIHRIETYKTKSGIGWDDVFGLKNANKETWICISDVNCFSRATAEQRAFIEHLLPKLGQDIAAVNDLELMQTIGDEIRIRGDKTAEDNIRHYAEKLVKSFEQATRKEFGTPYTLKTAAAIGQVSESFNGDHDNLQAVKSYNGDVFTRITAALHGMPRHKSGLKII